MGLYDAMNASVTGMNAQSNYLSNIGQNISNSSTPGYKEADTQFSTLVNSSGVGQTASGGVTTTTRLLVDKHGTPTTTSSTTDLAISGDGFFVVSDSSGQNYLTRAGSFVKDNNGNLVNAAGYYLMGYAYSNGTLPAMASNSLTGMSKVNVGTGGVLPASPSSKGTFAANLPSTATNVAAANLPSTAYGTTNASYTSATSIVTYDSVGSTQTLDVYFSKTATGWNVDVFDHAKASSTTGGFPYSAAPITSTTLTFNSSGALASVGGSATATSMTISPLPGSGTNSVVLDLSGMTQYATAYAVQTSTVNGNPASAVSSVTIGTDGTLSYQLASGTTVPQYKIPLANVASPDNLLASTGNVFSPNILSGQATVGTAGSGQLGTIKSGALEGSTVDVATELTNMIVAQRNYQANSKVFSTGAQLMDTLINMQV